MLAYTHQAIQEPEAFKDDKRLSFSWPKMHSLTHLVDSIKCRGVTPNYSTDQGEALHPQNKKYWSRSNHQASSSEQVYHPFGHYFFCLMFLFIQMLSMATEAEVIQKIRYQIDNYDELQELSQNSKLPEVATSNPLPQTQLCSPEANRTTLSAYNITLHQQHEITGFLDSLSTFLGRNNWVPDTDFYEVSV